MKVDGYPPEKHPASRELLKIINGRLDPVQQYIEQDSIDSSHDLDIEEYIKEISLENDDGNYCKVMDSDVHKNTLAQGGTSGSVEDLLSEGGDSASSSVLEFMLSEENHLSGLDLERIYRYQKEALDSEDSGSELSFSANDVVDATVRLHYVSSEWHFPLLE